MLQFVNRPALAAEPQSGSPVAVGRVVVMEPTDLNAEVADFALVVSGHGGLTAKLSDQLRPIRSSDLVRG